MSRLEKTLASGRMVAFGKDEEPGAQHGYFIQFWASKEEREKRRERLHFAERLNLQADRFFQELDFLLTPQEKQELDEDPLIDTAFKKIREGEDIQSKEF